MGEQNSQPMAREYSFEEKIEMFRKSLDLLGKDVMNLHKTDFFNGEQIEENSHSEAHANITLAFRHIEDARMRLGKVFQAVDGGISCYKR